MGIDSASGFSSNADELNASANFYINSVVKPYQGQIIKTLRKIFTVNNMDMPVRFDQLKPITTKFTNQDLMAVMSTEEIREELGLAPLNEEVVVHEDLTKMSEFTALEAFLDTLEDIPGDWELIKEEVVDGEHLDFDYEAELNNIADEKIELANTGRANPNARSDQDGLNRSGTAFYKVRYVYRNDNFLINKSGTTRDFCRIMEKVDKIYRKEDIDKMGGSNPGFGIDGSRYYNKFLWKGGPQCHHFWLRQIYKAPPEDDNYVYYPDNVQDEKNIGYTKARSEGFTAEKNDNLVAIPPRRMKNHGYYK